MTWDGPDAYLYQLNLDTGQIVWQTGTAQPPTLFLPPVVLNDCIYVQCQDLVSDGTVPLAVILAFDFVSGDLLNTYDVHDYFVQTFGNPDYWGFTTNMQVCPVSGFICFGYNYGATIALDPADQACVWAVPNVTPLTVLNVSNLPSGASTVSGELVYVTNTPGNAGWIAAVDALTGATALSGCSLPASAGYVPSFSLYIDNSATIYLPWQDQGSEEAYLCTIPLDLSSVTSNDLGEVGMVTLSPYSYTGINYVAYLASSGEGEQATYSLSVVALKLEDVSRQFIVDAIFGEDCHHTYPI
jgi:outer membrane protein assembly factor BamB